jgi:uncharacterized protein YjbJ (UPF0337 family)
MKIAAIQSKWDGFRRNVLNGWNKRRNDQLMKANGVQERSISILQKRYGYTKEEAASQLNKHYSRAWLG